MNPNAPKPTTMTTNLAANPRFSAVQYNYHKRILNLIPDLIFQISVTAQQEFFFTYLNKSIISFFEVNRFEIAGNPLEVIKNRIHPEDWDDFLQSIIKAKDSSEHWNHEFRVVLRTRGVLWFKAKATIDIDENGDAIFIGSLTDITDIKQREFRIIESEARYQFALEASNNGVWDYNVATDRVYFSKESLAILDFDASDNLVTNSKWDERIHPDDYIQYKQEIANHSNGQTTYFENTKRVLTKHGVYRWIRSKGKVIERDAQGNPLRIIGVHTDVTSEKEEEQALQAHMEIISKQNNRLLNFAHIVSHNLRSHTGNFKMLINIIDETDDPQQKEECFGFLKTTSKALSETIDHLKELVDIQSTIIHKKENLNLNAFLNHTLELLSKEIKDHNVNIVNLVDAKETVQFNPAYLESIFLNFTTNAIKYAHPDRQPEIRYSLQKEHGKLVLLIQDNGVGINLEKYGEKLFGMYKTFHQHPNARGIGLFITKNQIESMGGSIEVESQVNVGTTFKINFSNEIQ
jgi:PAS domain S-box-containing protein